MFSLKLRYLPKLLVSRPNLSSLHRLPKYNYNTKALSPQVRTRKPLATPVFKSCQSTSYSTVSSAKMSTEEDKLCEQVHTVAEDNAKMLDRASGQSSEQQPLQDGPSQQAEEPPLPKLTAAEFRAYNRMAVIMDQYHNHFRATWTELIKALRTSRPKNQSLRQFLSIAQGFCRQLEMHHNIEETYVFPMLAKKMPAFQKQNKEHGEMIKHHKLIHKGLEKFEKYVNDTRDGDKDFVASEMLEIMESFEKVLWTHLDEEVVQLGAENMRKYWTIDELKMLPM